MRPLGRRGVAGNLGRLAQVVLRGFRITGLAHEPRDPREADHPHNRLLAPHTQFDAAVIPRFGLIEAADDLQRAGTVGYRDNGQRT